MQSSPNPETRVLHLVNQSSFGGAQKFILELATHQSKQGMLISVAAGESQDPEFIQLLNAIPHTEFINLPHVAAHINLISDIRSIVQVRKAITNFKPSLIHVHSPKLALIAALAARTLKEQTPIVYTIHGFWVNEPGGVFKRLAHYLIEFATMKLVDTSTIGTQNELNDIVRSRIATRDTRIVVINPVLTPEPPLSSNGGGARDELEKLCGRSLAKTTVIGFIGNLFQGKGVLDLLEALKKLPESFVMVYFGKGDLEQELRARISAHNLGERAFLLGFKRNARQYIEGFDVFALPSEKEGISYVMLEAGALGIPAVATPVGGIPEHARENCVFVPAHDPEALARAILQASMLPKLPPYSQEHIQQTYNEFLQKMDGVYKAVLQKHHVQAK